MSCYSGQGGEGGKQKNGGRYKGGHPAERKHKRLLSVLWEYVQYTNKKEGETMEGL